MHYKRTWVSKKVIEKIHESLPVSQVYGWIFSSDEKLALVSKDGVNWQFPGGHPRKNEELVQTLKRELLEELSLDIESYLNKTVFLGYYLIEELGENGVVLKTYLQVRFMLNVPGVSKKLPIFPNESDSESEVDKIKNARWFDLNEAVRMIPWLANSGELRSVNQLIR